MLLNLSKPILYLITRGATTEATTAAAPEFTQLLNQISAAVAAGIDLIQIREKQLTARVLFELVSESRKLTRDSQTRLLVNDRADIAVGASADGVHLTTQSLDAATIRKTFGEQLLIGASTHSLDEVKAARDSGADFAVFGPVFETESKIGFGSPKGLEELSQVVRAVRSFPVLALGGVSRLNAAGCLAAGAQGIAGISLFDDPKDFISLFTALRHSGTNQTI
jgi:thiamine-phosphate pyrophosphorylase